MITYAYEAPEVYVTKRPGGNHLRGAKIRSSKDGYEYMRQFYGPDIDIIESAFILLLNKANNVISWAKISMGGIAGTVVDPGIVAKFAVDNLAKSVMLCHNHPSGNLQPSRHDEALTKQLKDGLKFLDISLIDHMIITSESFYSFADEGIL